MAGKVIANPTRLSPSRFRVSSGACAEGRLAGFRRLGSRLVEIVSEWRERARQRRALMELLTLPDHRVLRDLGVSRGDVIHEVNKPFWRP